MKPWRPCSGALTRWQSRNPECHPEDAVLPDVETPSEPIPINPTTDRAKGSTPCVGRPDNFHPVMRVMTSIRDVFPTVVLAALLVGSGSTVRADDAPSAVGPVMKLLKSGRVPEARLGQILQQVATRGNAHDLAYLYQQAVVERAFPAPLQQEVLRLLVDAGVDRGVTPAGDLSGIAQLIESAAQTNQMELEQAAIQLAGLWKVAPAADVLVQIVSDPESSAGRRGLALTALTRLGGDVALAAIQQLTEPDHPLALRMQAVVGLVRLDLRLAAERGAAILVAADADVDPQEMVSAFLDRQGGSAALAKAIEATPPSVDVAKRAMRAMYAVGRSDAELSSVLGKIAGIDSDPQPLSKEEVLALVPIVEMQGDALRGEAVFRRADLSCMKCHAVSKAGGQVGPDLSAIGASSPIDYILHSISDPDQQIKEAYATRIVVTDAGQVLQGIVEKRTDDTLVLKDAAGKSISIPVDSIEEEAEGKSLMPKGLMKFLTDGELLDLARFLSLLGKPNTDYAIRDTPRMQRWRVLTDLDERLVEEVPDFTDFEEDIYRSPQTLPFYSRVNGDVPLSELTALRQQPVVYLVGDVSLTQPGAVGVRVDETAGVTLWIDKHRVEWTDPTAELPVGVHPLTLRIDTRERSRQTLRLELFRPADSQAEFTVVDGD